MSKFDVKSNLQEMYADSYFPDFLVDKIYFVIEDVHQYLELEKRGINDVQAKLDDMTDTINDIAEEFYENDSDIETAARECIALTVENLLLHFNIEIDTEEAIRNRDW